MATTAAVDAQAQRDHEAKILGESALIGENAVAWLRIITWVVLGIAFSKRDFEHAEAHGPEQHGLLHASVVVGWLLFAIAVKVMLGRLRRFTPRQAQLWPALFTLVDFSAITILSLSGEPATSDIMVANMSILLAFAVARFSGIHVALSAALAFSSYVLVGVRAGWIEDTTTAVVAASFAMLALVVWWANRRVRRMFVDVRRRDHLSRLLPSQVAERILAAGGRPLEPVQREVTILFSDLRDFTTLSQRMEPQRVLALLDDYFARMTGIVKTHEGMVNKLLGDGLMAVWGVPAEQPDHAVKAVRAALAMRRALAELNAAASDQQPKLRIGVGLHTGIVAAGMLGGPDQHEYTVIGDAVNLTSRIEGLTKKLGTDILVSEATWTQCQGAVAGERVGQEQVKGRDEPVVVYTVA